MPYVDEYRPLVAALVKARGSLGVDSKGDSVPAMTGDDMIAVLAVYTRGVVNAVAQRAHIVPSFVDAPLSGERLHNVDSNGVVRLPFGLDKYDAKQYVSAPPSSVAWQRFCDPSSTWEPARLDAETLKDYLTARDAQGEQIMALRECMDEYQDAVTQVVTFLPSWGLLGSAGVLLAGSAVRDAVAAFLRSIRLLGTTLDVLGENPPTTFQQDVAGALVAAKDASKAAIEDASRLAGDLAAGIANEAGKIGGEFAEGFFSTANLLTLVIAGALVYKFV